jgi:Flp pilus assembly CpaF family ATPase
MSDGSERPELTSLPMFANGTPRPGRVRSTFRLNGHSPEPPPSSPIALVEAARLPSTLRLHRRGGSPDWAEVARLRTAASHALTEALGLSPTMPRTEQERLGRTIVSGLLDADDAEFLVEHGHARSLEERERLTEAVFDALFRLGRLQPLLDDPSVENVMITGHDRVVVERADGLLEKVDPVADSDEELLDFLTFLAGRASNPRPFSSSQPSLHLRLEDGSRLAAARDTVRPSVVIRRHRMRRAQLSDLVERGTVSPVMADFLAAAVRARRSIVVSGEQGHGKTTLVRALCAEIDPWEVLGTFETECELFLHELDDDHHLVHAWEERPGSGERAADGSVAGERRTSAQVFDSFRFTLGRQILGEIRGAEVWSMIKLMESGSGSLSTTHSSDAYETLEKLITCAMEAGPHITMELAAAKLAATIDLVVHLRCEILRGDNGTARKIRRVSEILAVEPGEERRRYSLTSVFRASRGRIGIADTPPPERMLDALIGAGFDHHAFLAEAQANPRVRP